MSVTNHQSPYRAASVLMRHLTSCFCYLTPQELGIGKVIDYGEA